ncbi:Eco57I restriction-modification methylase domain-containing protein [Coleofasciculus sp. FACHB-712]|uniref:Eco57I restriction-modification methylase domain-containing protein n=1 Tax=Coleofasciculus sp. FACHB-712 TaxID=2692789 RepID=UPI001685F52D|nr:DNA methyltransferase [Coleofasciculus sp. FACHB-712]MBD1944849.1 Eco57I restriction-modification methylase domain-containing protein [Coleofasciculus sp. FACHB-712]
MQIDLKRSQQYLKQFQFQLLFIEELGWDNYSSQPLSLLIENKSYALKPVAEKRGQVVYTCLSEDGTIPNSVTRTKIHKEVSRYSLENVLIYIDQGETEQVWQWVRRDPGKPQANRFHQFHKSQSGDALLQKLEALAVAFDEEDQLTLVDVTSRTRRAFDVDRVTKKFYERFKKEHGLFLKFIAGIHSQFDQEWYCSLMLNRLMFVYFIQKKDFLDGNTNYLRDRLQSCQSLKGQGSFHSFYRYFLLKLFHSGLGDPIRSPELEQLLGKVPYLNGGLFEVHQLEEKYPDIQIPDQAFEKVFDFFDEYYWHLDDRPLHNDREINPDVLGYIFEKYINQKQMGAYYTKEDITEYISKNTIIPFLFNAAEKSCSIAFQPNGSVWRLLKDNPNRYIYTAMQKGVELPLPDAITAGMADISQRQGWNRPADSEYALPTETWREHITRRQRCLELREKLSDGKVHSIDDLITLNLDIRQFAQDVIENCEGSELVRAFYNAICQVSILDPTCGSGAFLFAALNILEPLYDSCLERMQVFLDDLKRSDHPHHPETFGDLRKILNRVAQHPNRRYFILKSIILNNLYGVDIMEEATEICKLRLFLKLVSQVERDPYAPNYGLEPLPDIDFNIRAGNTLVGFVNYEKVKEAVEGNQQKKLDLFSDMERINRNAEEADQAFQLFRSVQTEQAIDKVSFREAKNQLRNRLRALNQELNRYLAELYTIGLSKKTKEYENWLVNHQPFHWFVEFYRIIAQGGFDIIIGNPPYVESNKVKEYKVHGYESEPSRNLYAFTMERSAFLQKKEGRFGMIVPVSAISLGATQTLRDVLQREYPITWISSYSFRPGKLFEGVNLRLSLFLGGKLDVIPKNYSTKYNQWYTDERPFLFENLSYREATSVLLPYSIPKIGTDLAVGVVQKVLAQESKIGKHLSRASGYLLHYHRSPLYWIRAMDFEPFFKSPSQDRSVHHFRDLYVNDDLYGKFIGAVLNSNLFFIWFVMVGNCRNLTGDDVKFFAIGEPSNMALEKTANLFDILMDDYKNNSRIRTRRDAELQEFYPSLSKPIIDKIDRLLAQHYGFTDNELDFIINYDIKYRMGRDTEDEE